MANVNPIQVETYLKGIHYPASQADLLTCAQQNVASDDVNAMLRQLPDQLYGSTVEVSEAIGAIDRSMGSSPSSPSLNANPIQVETFLKGIHYPASTADLIDRAQQDGADDRVMTTLTLLPDQTFYSTTDVSQAIGAIDRNS